MADIARRLPGVATVLRLLHQHLVDQPNTPASAYAAVLRDRLARSGRRVSAERAVAAKHTAPTFADAAGEPAVDLVFGDVIGETSTLELWRNAPARSTKE